MGNQCESIITHYRVAGYATILCVCVCVVGGGGVGGGGGGERYKK